MDNPDKKKINFKLLSSEVRGRDIYIHFQYESITIGEKPVQLKVYLKLIDLLRIHTRNDKRKACCIINKWIW